MTAHPGIPWYGWLTVLLSLITGVLVSVVLWQSVQRTREIERSRVASCELTYEGIRQIFQPFIASSTPRERSNLRRINRRIDHLKSLCPEQTRSDR